MKKMKANFLAVILGGVFFFCPYWTRGKARKCSGYRVDGGPYGHAQDHWDQPPSEFNEFERKGFHDGIEGAKKDFDNHRAPSPENRDEFRHPHVPDHDKDAHRRGFQRGYQVGWEHISHGRSVFCKPFGDFMRAGPISRQWPQSAIRRTEDGRFRVFGRPSRSGCPDLVQAPEPYTRGSTR